MNNTPEDRDRIYSLDAARAIMLTLGIPFHSSEIYRISSGFTVDSPDGSYVASMISACIHVFRMPAFFMLSGYFAAMILSKRATSQWLADRFWKLGVPLVCTAALLGPVENAIELANKQNISFLEAVRLAVQLPLRQWINHRWFLVVLLLYCLTAAIFITFVKRDWRKIKYMTPKPIFLCIIAIPIMILIPFIAIATGKLFDGILLNSPALKQYSNLYMKYFVFFAVGFYVSGVYGSMSRVTDLSPVEVLLGSLFVLIYIATYFAFYDAPVFAPGNAASTVLSFVRIGIEVIAGMYAARFFFWLIYAFFQSHNPVISYFVAGSFCIYLVHEVFLLMFGAFFVGVSLSPIVEIIIITCATIICSVAVFEIVRRSAPLSLIFNGGPIKLGPVKQQVAR